MEFGPAFGDGFLGPAGMEKEDSCGDKATPRLVASSQSRDGQAVLAPPCGEESGEKEAERGADYRLP